MLLFLCFSHLSVLDDTFSCTVDEYFPIHATAMWSDAAQAEWLQQAVFSYLPFDVLVWVLLFPSVIV